MLKIVLASPLKPPGLDASQCQILQMHIPDFGKCRNKYQPIIAEGEEGLDKPLVLALTENHHRGSLGLSAGVLVAEERRMSSCLGSLWKRRGAPEMLQRGLKTSSLLMQASPSSCASQHLPLSLRKEEMHCGCMYNVAACKICSPMLCLVFLFLKAPRSLICWQVFGFG